MGSSFRNSRQLAYLPQLATILRPVAASDGAGKKTRTYSEHLTRVPCRVSGINSIQQQRGAVMDRSVIGTGVIITLPAGTDVAATDRVVVNEQTYNIVGNQTSPTYGTAVRLLCTAVE